MRLSLPVCAAAVALLACCPVVAGQTAESWFPVAPTLAEVEKLPAETRLRQQTALKSVWLERLIRARDEQHRVTRENVAASVLQAQQQGAPAAFVSMLRRLAAGNLPARQRHVLETAVQDLLGAYAVDAREMRFFVEGVPLTSEQLRDAVAWLPLEDLFNMPPSAEKAPASVEEAAGYYAEMVAARRALYVALRGVNDRASADAAAEALLPALRRYTAAVSLLMLTPEKHLRSVVGPRGLATVLQVEDGSRERSRLMEHEWYGSHRLQVIDILIH